MKTTKAHFKLFKDECRKWIGKFGLLDYEIHYTHDDYEGSFAYCVHPDNRDDRIFTLGLSRNLIDGYDESNVLWHIKHAAFHEIMEILLYPFQYLAETRFICRDEIDNERHRVIRILENVIFNG